MIRNEYAPLMCGLVMIALCWVGCAYVLIAHGDLHRLLRSDRLPRVVNRCVNWELTKVLAEMDIRNPSPEHEAFLRAYDRRQNHCGKGK